MNKLLIILAVAALMGSCKKNTTKPAEETPAVQPPTPTTFTVGGYFGASLYSCNTPSSGVNKNWVDVGFPNDTVTRKVFINGTLVQTMKLHPTFLAYKPENVFQANLGDSIRVEATYKPQQKYDASDKMKFGGGGRIYLYNRTIQTSAQLTPTTNFTVNQTAVI